MCQYKNLFVHILYLIVFHMLKNILQDDWVSFHATVRRIGSNFPALIPLPESRKRSREKVKRVKSHIDLS